MSDEERGSESKDTFKEKLFEVKKENLRLEKRIQTAEVDVQELEEALQSGLKVAQEEKAGGVMIINMNEGPQKKEE